MNYIKKCNYIKQLPEKWCVRIKNNEQRRILLNWTPIEIREHYKNSKFEEFCYPSFIDGVGFKVTNHTGYRGGYTRIEFEDFVKLVLKEFVYELY